MRFDGLIDIAPVILTILLAVAGMIASVVPQSPASRVIWISIFILLGAGAVAVTVVHQQRAREQSAQLRTKLEAVHSDIVAILEQQKRNQGRTTTEQDRRDRILQLLRQEYILSHDNISPAMMAGLEMPPADWLNRRLHELGEGWAIP